MHVHTLLCLILSIPASGQGDVEVVIRDPAGKPVANRSVRVIEVELASFPQPVAGKSQEMKTDLEGRVRLALPVGLRQLRVRVAGVGFGATGIFEARADQIARPELPRLAKFARVEGKIDPELFKSPMTVDGRHSAYPENKDLDAVSVLCDPEGRFVFEEVVPDELHLSVRQDRLAVAAERVVIPIEPGQTRGDVRIGPPKPPDPIKKKEEQRFLDQMNRPQGGEITWVEGIVRDVRGVPLAGAEVMVKAVYFPGMRNNSRVLTTCTDAKGHYEIRGPHFRFMQAFTVVVLAPDHATLLAYARVPGQDDKPPRDPLDLTVPDRGGALNVRVLRDGKAVAGVNVSLREQGVVERAWSMPDGNSPALNRLHKPFNPVEGTDKDGVARFTDLYPCHYELRARLPGEGVVVPVVEVAAGETSTISLALQPEIAPVRHQALRPDGTRVGHKGISFSFGLREIYAGSGIDFDTNGVGTYGFADRGLWAVMVRFRDAGNPSMPENWEPYYEGSALLPISPSFKLEEPVKLRCDPHLPGSIRAQLVGLDGKPARGTILLLVTDRLERGVIANAATTDDDGIARFTGLTSGRYRLRGSMEQYQPPYLPSGIGPLPDDETLRNQIVFPAESVQVESGTEARLNLQPIKAGYVRGRITPPPGVKASDYFVNATIDWWKLPSGTRQDATRVEYLIGPLLPGKFEIRLRRRFADDQPLESPQFVTLAPGEIARIDLKAEDRVTPAGRPAQAVSLGMGGLSTMELPPEAMAGTVFHADGKTPAFGARAVLMVPKELQPTSSAISDAAGHLTWTGLWIMRGNSSASPNPPGQVTTPTVVVSLPGLAGATVIAIDPKNPKPFRAVLPPPMNASGRVTLGGLPITTQDARIRVIAGYRGRGVLDGPLSVEAIVEADGRFTLRGLTPGTFQVQAARDGIWLSRSVTLNIAPDRKTDELILDVPDPGAAVTLALVGENQRPAGRTRLKLVRPDGPLAALWPDHVFTDAEGIITLRGLEVGPHSFRIDGEAAPHTIDVPGMAQGPARRLVTIKPDPKEEARPEAECFD